MSIQDEMQALLDAMATAYRAGDAGACAEFFAPQGEVHSPWGPPAIGRVAIRDLHQEWTRDGGAKTFQVLQAGCSGDLAWCLARFSDGAVTGSGTSLSVLERAGDGWLIKVCALHADPE